MLIDFTEIPQANKGRGHQDHFELFARDFLQMVGYKIIMHPDRGPDGKRDLIVSDTRTGAGGDETTFTWLVSCKHYAHSGSSVPEKEEINITERLNTHNCNGFIGVYSTISSANLNAMLYGNKNKFNYIIFDPARIEDMIVSNKTGEKLLLRYFPKSYKKYKEEFKKIFSPQKPIEKALTENDILRITKTAMITLQIEDIKEDYWNAKWAERDGILKRLSKYSEHTNPEIEKVIIDFLYKVSNMTRAGIPYDSAGVIFWVLLDFFPLLTDKKHKVMDTENATTCIHIGENMAYDAFIYLRNLATAMWGLNILKYVYRTAKQNKISKLMKDVKKTYDELEDAIKTQRSNDTKKSLELLHIFKADLEEWDISFPSVPSHLMRRIENDKTRIK